MWIIPSNHPMYSACALGFSDWSGDLIEFSDELTSSLMWKSKPSLLKTWLQRWNRVYWLRHLYGRMLKPSMAGHFVIKYAASLEVIHANRFPTPVHETELPTRDTFTRIYQELSKQQDLFGASLRTSKDTSRWDMIVFTKTWSQWVTMLRQDSSRRQKLAHHMRGQGYSSSQSGETGNWPTPATRDYKGANGDEHFKEKERPHMGQLPNAVKQEQINGQPDRDNPSTNGKSQEQLNPAWVAQLMGTTLEKTFFVHMVTP